MSPNLDLKQGISYLERERGREIKEIDRKIEGRGSETDDNKNPKQSWVAQLVLKCFLNLIFFFYLRTEKLFVIVFVFVRINLFV
jgi:hypothetical protein